jgi:two-component system osmolarity sensor histidine kinase EnvZ
LKRILPRTLFGRSVLILVTPLILVQAVATWVFYDRLWDTVVRRLASAAAGDIALTIDARALNAGTGSTGQLFELAHGSTEFSFQLIPGAELPDRPPPPTGSLIERHLTNALAERVGRPFQIDERSQADQHIIDIAIQLPDGVLDVAVPRSRVLIGAPYIFILWMVGTALVTFWLATQFLHNQVRSLRRLADAAEAFGKGRDVPNFKPEGATEVRQAAAAFLVMRERLQRQISQRTEMLAGVSHDLRTPLTRMKLELELLGDVEEVQGLRGDVAEMQQMIEGYLAFARGEGNEQPAIIDLMDFLSDVVATARRDSTEISLIGPEELHVPLLRHEPDRQRQPLRRPCLVDRHADAECRRDDDRRRRPGHPRGAARSRVPPFLPPGKLTQPSDRRHRPRPHHRARHHAEPRRRVEARDLAARRPARAADPAALRQCRSSGTQPL